jgi:hypothetical protein
LKNSQQRFGDDQLLATDKPQALEFDFSQVKRAKK